MGTHGGRRNGAGRRPGSKTNPVLARNKAVAAQTVAEIVASERDPLLRLLAFAEDEKLDVRLRLDAAIAACKFVHPSLAATQVSATHTVHRAPMTGEQAAALVRDGIQKALARRAEAAALAAPPAKLAPTIEGRAEPVPVRVAEEHDEDEELRRLL